MFLKTKSGKLVELPSFEENVAIEAAAALDSDAPIFTDEEWQQIKPRLRHLGRPKAEKVKVHQGMRFSPEVLEYFRATGKGWQTRVDEVLSEWVAAQKTGGLPIFEPSIDSNSLKNKQKTDGLEEASKGKNSLKF